MTIPCALRGKEGTMKTRNIFILAILALAMLCMSGCGKKDESTPAEPQEKVTPTFMYFYTNDDTQTVEEIQNTLASEYADKINFNFINVDEDAEALENFSLVAGNTPALIMLNTDNNISALEFKCADTEVLKSDIEAALQ